jgi:hypothetical protein
MDNRDLFDPGYSAFLIPGSGIPVTRWKKIRIRDEYLGSQISYFWGLKYVNSLLDNRDLIDPGSGNGQIRIRDTV